MAHDLPARARLVVRNRGARDGSEVVQCYARDPVAAGQLRPWRRLVGFARVEVAAGQSAAVTVSFTRDALALRDEHGAWRVLPGEYLVHCGRSSDDADALVGTLVLPG